MTETPKAPPPGKAFAGIEDPGGEALGRAVAALAERISARRHAPPGDSYTSSLLKEGGSHCARKFGEEAIELVIASLGDDIAATRAEAADAIYHLLVLLAARNISPRQLADELDRRAHQSGHAEKAARNLSKEARIR